MNRALNHVENFSRLRRKGMVIWGGGIVYAKVRSTWEVATGSKEVDASREGELLFQSGWLREEEVLGMEVGAGIQVIGRASANPLVRLHWLQRVQKKKTESENPWEATDGRLKLE